MKVMTIRAYIFWLFDKIREKGIVRKYYDEIVQGIEGGERFMDPWSEQLNRILEYSVKNVPFYKKMQIISLSMISRL